MSVYEALNYRYRSHFLDEKFPLIESGILNTFEKPICILFVKANMNEYGCQLGDSTDILDS